MKIQSLLSSVGYREVLRQRDAVGDESPKRQNEQQSAGDEKEKENEAKLLSFDAVAEELTHFSEENAANLAGISTSIEGNGPGLTVTLKDGKGAVVRQLTGQEFMEMRVSARGVGRGQLIDKKL